MYEFDAPPSKLDKVREECSRDVDIIRSMIYKTNIDEPFECTIEEEMKPPPYRFIYMFFFCQSALSN